MILPAAVARLFAHEDLTALVQPPGRGLLIGRLLEEGDSRDLQWLFAELPTPHVAAWLARNGGRKLSRRSRAFWSEVLATPVAEPAPQEIWPL